MGSMKDQLGDSLFEYAHARPSDPITSHRAAKSIERRMAPLMAAVLDAIRSRGDLGATWDEIAHITKLDKGSISPRLKPLRERGLITEKRIDGKIITRSAPGKRCGQIAWVARDPAR